jgi:hypothetical protein
MQNQFYNVLYSSDCWRVTKTDMRSLSNFHHSCLWKICRTFWPNKISNINLLKLMNSNCIVQQIQQRWFRWPGHVFRMSNSSITKTALRWTPQGKRPRGQPKMTWRQIIKQELKMTWSDIEWSRNKGQATHSNGQTLCWPYAPIWAKRISK